MKNKTKFLILIIPFILTFGIIQINIPINPTNFNAESKIIQNFTYKQVKSSTIWSIPPIVIDDSGSGDYTWAEAVLQPWCSGAGTQNNPYIIENIFIDAGSSGNGLVIRNSNKYFIIRNSTFTNSGWLGNPPYNAGILLNTVTNGNLINNTCSNNQYGISIYKSDGMRILNNSLKNKGISIILGDNIIVKENTLRDGGISFAYGSNNDIIFNDIRDGGIDILGDLYNVSKSSDYNNISMNSINNSNNGIDISGYSRYNEISYNTIFKSSGNGISLYAENFRNCGDNLILGNVISNSSSNGIKLDVGSISNIIQDNIISNTSQVGFLINSQYSTGNKIYNNYFITNNKHALDKGLSNEWNSAEVGNYWDNYTGIDFDDDGIGDTPYNISVDPLIQDMFPIWDDGDDPTPPELTVINPGQNQVLGSDSPVFEISSKSLYINTKWYNINNSATNYIFTNLTGKIDQNSWNQFADVKIPITFYANDSLGNIGSTEVLVEKDTVFPIINIDSPRNGEEFGEDAPDYDITITEKNLLSCWYTIAGGAIEYSCNKFLDNRFAGEINQLKWNNTPDGNITITFFAFDKAGHLSNKSIIVTKNIPTGTSGSSSRIPGYNLFLLVGAIVGVMVFLMRKKYYQ